MNAALPANPCAAPVAAWLAGVPAGVRRAVAFSAGADSTALLLAAHAACPGQLIALHVHHGLQVAADGFESHARQFCETRGIAFASQRVLAAHAPGESPEDAARRARYLCLADLALAHGCAEVWLAQHADDQVETLLLALSRGAGLPGLASMPARFERHGMAFARPILAVDGAAIRTWLQDSGEPFVDDPTNTDTRFIRNRIRQHLLPAWRAQFPAYQQTLARSARHAAQAQRLLDEVAAQDLLAVGQPPLIARLRVLSAERQANLLRHWLRQGWQAGPSEAQMAALLRQLAACATRGHHIRLKVADGHVLRDGDVLVFER
ncbi:tRNA lysidine(34) synthetase TilS [Hydrogenophaga sp. OTU3427]|uniref:tRNA lysidine(34) synthetase TilS n=1 Tax=Hydrogenophaga sp. OTU3427 TaxID=3043856 RepID=UPI00406CCB1E